MLLKWTQHLDGEEEKENFQREVRAAGKVLDRIKTILGEELNGLDRSEIDIRVFDLPNWENRQAFKNGYRSCLDTISKLITIKD